MTAQIVPLILALIIAALTLLPFAGWTERICAVAMMLPTAIGLFDLEVVATTIAFYPSLLLRMTLEATCLLLLLYAAFTDDRWFPLVMAAAALIGLTARCLMFTGLGGPHLPMLQMSALPLLTMTTSLFVGIAVKVVSRSLSNAPA